MIIIYSFDCLKFEQNLDYEVEIWEHLPLPIQNLYFTYSWKYEYVIIY